MNRYDPSFTTIMRFTLAREGGLSDDADDPGGITKHGISLRFLRSLGELGDSNDDGSINDSDIRGLTLEQAESLYFVHFWLRQQLSAFPELIAMSQFDTAVNCGLNRAARILQQALCDVGTSVTIDGIIGAQTRSAVKSVCCSTRGELLLVQAMSLARIRFYVELASLPVRAKYLRGWVRRAADVALFVTSYQEAT